MIRFLIVFIFCICNIFTPLQSQISLSIPSVIVEKNENFTIDVPISFESGKSIDSFSISLKFNPQVVSLISANVVAPTVIPCDSLLENTLYTPPDKIQVLLSCNSSFVGASNQTIRLSFLALAGKDSQTVIEVESIRENGQTISITSPISGTITIRNNKQVVQNFPEFLGQNYPNPVSVDTDRPYTTTFPYSINNQTDVMFSVFNSKGQKILTFPTIQRDRGEFTFVLGMDPTQFSSGTYSLQMETNEGVYFQSFLYLK